MLGFQKLKGSPQNKPTLSKLLASNVMMLDGASNLSKLH